MKNIFCVILIFAISATSFYKTEAADLKDDLLILVNDSNPVQSTYSPKTTIIVSDFLPSKYASIVMQKEAGENLIEMFAGLNAAGIPDLKVSSGFRTYQIQTVLNNNKVAEYKDAGNKNAYELAKRVVALPGRSEHQTGLAVDVTLNGNLVQSFGNTAAGKWLKDNSYKYGYILRYPEGKTSITGIIYEPWHFRYVGEPHAQIMYERNWCLEEYIGRLHSGVTLTQETTDGRFEVIYSTTDVIDGVYSSSKDNVYGYIITRLNSPEAVPVMAATPPETLSEFISYRDFMLLFGVDLPYSGGKLQRQKAMALAVQTLNLEEKAPLKFSDTMFVYTMYRGDLEKLAAIDAIVGVADNFLRPTEYITWGEALELSEKLK